MELCVYTKRKKDPVITEKCFGLDSARIVAYRYLDEGYSYVTLSRGVELFIKWVSPDREYIYLPKEYHNPISQMLSSMCKNTGYTYTGTTILQDNFSGELVFSSKRNKDILVNYTEENLKLGRMYELESYVKVLGFEGLDYIMFTPRTVNKCKSLRIKSNRVVPKEAGILFNTD